jgi:truncated hemoglobin YjbI
MKTMRSIVHAALLAALLAVQGCGSEVKNERDFFTSGSREADQRAEQRMAKSDQLRGDDAGNQQPAKLSLFERLGGETGLRAIVDDFVARALADPQVNWERRGISSGGLLRRHSEEWMPTAANVEKLKKHITQFLALKTGGPAKYEGGDMKAKHAGMKITNPEFDAAVGDLKATLDKMKIGISEQKELLAIIESTRPQVVEKR